MSFFLVTTADERTWPSKKKIAFLGEWCFKESRKHIWENMDYEIIRPTINKKIHKIEAINEIYELKRIFLPKLSSKLNDYNKSNYSDRFWEMLIGHWLIRFISTMSNRFYSLKNALENYDISQINFLYSPNYKISTLDTVSFTYATNCEVWNNMVFLKLFNFFSINKIRTSFIKISDTNFQYSRINTKKNNYKQKLKKFIFYLLSNFVKNNNAVIFNSYLSSLDEIKLSIYLNQIPFFYDEVSYEINFQYNRDHVDIFPRDSKKSLFQFLNQHIYSALPIIYLEKFFQIQSIINSLNWPKKPKFIFTSNGFDTNEVFKFWTAKNAELSIPFFVGQHGNNYGQNLLQGRMFWPERSTADGFITWGWDDNARNNLVGFNFKKGFKKIQKLKDGGLVLVNTCAQFRWQPWDSVEEFKKNLNEQYNFLDNISQNLRGNITVRLHHTSVIKHNIEQFNEKGYLIKKYPFVKIDDGHSKLQTLIDKNKLFVFSYDATGILEFLLSDIPFVAFWPNETSHIIDDKLILGLYKDFYELGIFFKNGKDAADSINKNWHQIQEWWNSKRVIIAKDNFKNHFSKFEKNIPMRLKEILLNKLK